jgi:cytidyltransferase-like protein
MPSSAPKLGPEPTLLSRKEVDALYETLQAVLRALQKLGVDAIVTGGSLLGAVRQHSILFCDDDIDLTVIDYDSSVYDRIVQPQLQQVLGDDYIYQIRPWEGGDRIRPKRMTNVFLDLFVLRRFNSMEEFTQLIGVKKNGQPQSEEYVQGIVEKLQTAAVSQDEETQALCPFWQFSTRKAVEMWTKEVYRESELFPLDQCLKMGPVTGISGPLMSVKLLKRAFGMDCFDIYYQSASHKTESKPTDHHKESSNGSVGLPPLVSTGGTWEGGHKTPLQDEHYLPMQPIARAARRHTLHNKEQLFQYLERQSKLEDEWSGEAQEEGQKQDASEQSRPSRTIYMDGVFDLFHIGHLKAIETCAQLGNRVILGVTGDEDAAGYKRPPIVPESERVAIVQALQHVDEVVCPCPLVVTEEFMEQHKIDLVVHGFANDADAKRQEEFFETPMRLGKFQRISYYHGLSTTERIQNIQALMSEEEKLPNGSKPEPLKPQWFGASLAAATNHSATIPVDPFPLELRQAIETHIRKATKRREEALGAIRQATGAFQCDPILSDFRQNLAKEGGLQFDTTLYPIRAAFLETLDLPADYDLSRIHESEGAKDKLLHTLTKHPTRFQEAVDHFVRSVCAPHLASIYTCEEIYYQAFPCLRMVQPDEFSIGPHADVAYGHHPCSVNFYLPLTQIEGTSSLFLESRHGAEDWHPIDGDYGYLKHFAGAMCLHWTTENKTEFTRVSVDFRLIPGPMFHALKDGSSFPGGQKDVYRNNDGYYSCCRKEMRGDESVVWNREGPLLAPDARIGFPWTVKDWDKFWSKK